MAPPSHSVRPRSKGLLRQRKAGELRCVAASPGLHLAASTPEPERDSGVRFLGARSFKGAHRPTLPITSNQSFLMKSFAALAALAALAVAGAQAGPMSCHRATGDMELTIWNNHKIHPHAYDESVAFKEHNGERLLYRHDGETQQRFAFYQCDSPPEGYKAPSKNHPRGQVRSVKHPHMCLNIHAIDNRKLNHGYDNQNGILSLRPCSQDPQLQWWQMNKWEDDLSRGMLSHLGRENDTPRDRITGGDSDALMMYTTDDDLGYTSRLMLTKTQLK